MQGLPMHAGMFGAGIPEAAAAQQPHKLTCFALLPLYAALNCIVHFFP
jgi:hypothetical protein